MTHGIDTDFLVAAEIRDHPFHRQADALMSSLLTAGHDFAVVPQLAGIIGDPHFAARDRMGRDLAFLCRIIAFLNYV